MGFARQVPADGLLEGYVREGWCLVTQVLPMGFTKSVAIEQRVHRRVINHALRSGRLDTGHQETRRDRGSSGAGHG